MVHPLPWSRTYLLVLPAGRAAFDPIVPSDTAGFRGRLASDAVRAEARGADRSAWSDPAPTCSPTPLPDPPRPTGNDDRHVAFIAGDEIAQALAARVVALSEDPGAKLLAVAPNLMPRMLRDGAAGAFIVSVPLVPSAPCLERSLWPPEARVVPLIDIRLNAIVRQGVPPLTVSYDGRIRPADVP